MQVFWFYNKKKLTEWIFQKLFSTFCIYRLDQGSASGTHFKIRDWDQDSNSKFEVTKKFRDLIPGTENFPGHGPGPVPTRGLDYTKHNVQLWTAILVSVARILQALSVQNYYNSS